MVAHLKPSASHAAHLHRFTNAALFRVLLNKLYLFIYLFVCFLFIYFFEKYFSYFFVLNCSTLMMKKVKKLTGSLIHFSFLTFWISFCPIRVTICQLVIFYIQISSVLSEPHFPCCTKSLTNLNPYQSCLLFFCLLFSLCFRPGGTYGDDWEWSQPTMVPKYGPKIWSQNMVPKYGSKIWPQIWSQKVVPTSFKIVPPGLCFCFNGAQKESTCTSKYSWKKFNLFPESPEGLLKLSLTSWNALSKFASAELLLLL